MVILASTTTVLENACPYRTGGKKNNEFFFLIIQSSDIEMNINIFRELTAKDPKSELGYTVTLLVDCNRLNRPLNIVHVPSLGCMVCIRMFLEYFRIS